MSITCQWLYNGLQKEKQQVILVDCRDYDEYEKDHIASSVCMPPELGLNEDGEEDFVDLTELNTAYFKHGDHFHHYETREQKYLVVYNDNDHNMWIGHVISCMDVEGVVKNVQALEEGFQEFKRRYSFLVTSDPNPQSLFTIEGHPFPVEINFDSLFLSVSASQDINPMHINSLNIDTILHIGVQPTVAGLCTNTNVSFVQLHTQENKGVIATDGCAEEFITIMESMEAQNKRVLLHSQKQEEILTLAILYLLNTKKSLRESYNIVIQSFWIEGVALDSQYIKWLVQEEIRLLGSASVTENEIESGSIVEVTASKYCSLS